MEKPGFQAKQICPLLLLAAKLKLKIPNWNRASVSAKSKWGQILTVPICSAGPETSSTQVIAVPPTCQNTMEHNSIIFLIVGLRYFSKG